MYPSQRQRGATNSHNYPYPSHNHQVSNDSSHLGLGARAAYAMTSALADPYGQTRAFYSYTNPNYAQAYWNQMQQQQRPRTTEEGYTFSSTYDPSSSHASTISVSSSSGTRQNLSSHVPIRAPPNRPNERQQFRHPPRRPPLAGSEKCTYHGCSFSGSKNAVEIHRMDRHLIYPPGWKKKTDDWDADPSLKGLVSYINLMCVRLALTRICRKPVPIFGTSLLLDTPEAIDAWIAERKKRWPSKRNMAEKEKREKEAQQRGEINPSDLSGSVTKGTKRRRLGDNNEGRAGYHQHRSVASGLHRPRKVIDFTDDNKKDSSGDLNTSMQTAGTEVNPSFTTGTDNFTDPANGTHVTSLAPSRIPKPVSPPFSSLSSAAHDNHNSADDSGSDIDPINDAISSKRPVNIPEEYPSSPTVEERRKHTQSTLPGSKVSLDISQTVQFSSSHFFYS